MSLVRILLADDHPAITESIGELLTRKGYDVVMATDGIAALEQCARATFDLVILDLMLPEVSGIEFLQQIAARPKPPRVIVYSALVSPELVQLSISLGAHGYIDKAGSIDELIRGIERVLAGQVVYSAVVMREIHQLLGARYQVRSHQLAAGDLPIIKRFARGEPVKAIAADLSVSVSAVYKSLDRIRRVTGCQVTTDFVRLAGRLGLELVSPTLSVSSGAQSP